MTSNPPKFSRRPPEGWPTLLTIITGLLLVAYLCVPLILLSLAPETGAQGMQIPWPYYIFMSLMAVILLILYIIQIRMMRKNIALKTFFMEANQQKENILHKNITLATEIRRRRAAESTLKLTNENLEAMVKKRTAKLDSALNDLRDTQAQLVQSGKLASIGELAAGVAHELNQPLMVIRGNVQLMSRAFYSSETMADQIPTVLDTIERNTKRMTLIINHLRSFSRQSIADFQQVDVNQVIKDAFLMIGEQLRLRNIETVKDLAEHLPKIKGAPYQLEQVFLNMITNARDAIESYKSNANGGFRQSRRLEITTRLTNGDRKNVEILFKDTGCGISQENRTQIFDPFFTTKAAGKGTGLGLSLSYGILKDHGGHLQVLESCPGSTTISIRLPISLPQA